MALFRRSGRGTYPRVGPPIIQKFPLLRNEQRRADDDGEALPRRPLYELSLIWRQWKWFCPAPAVAGARAASYWIKGLHQAIRTSVTRVYTSDNEVPGLISYCEVNRLRRTLNLGHKLGNLGRGTESEPTFPVHLTRFYFSFGVGNSRGRKTHKTGENFNTNSIAPRDQRRLS